MWRLASSLKAIVLRSPLSEVGDESSHEKKSRGKEKARSDFLGPGFCVFENSLTRRYRSHEKSNETCQNPPGRGNRDVSRDSVRTPRGGGPRPATDTGCALATFRKEVIQPQVLLRLPCYDFTPIMSHTLGACLLAVGTATSSTAHFRDVTGGVYKARERIHGAVLMRHY